MKITKKIRLFAFFSAFLVVVLSFSCFAGFDSSPDEDRVEIDGDGNTIEVDYSKMPFLTLSFAVGATSNQGYFSTQLQMLLQCVQNAHTYQMVLANPDCYYLEFVDNYHGVMRFSGDSTLIYSMYAVADSSVDIPDGYSSAYRVVMRINATNGVYTIKESDEEFSYFVEDSFLMTWNVAYVFWNDSSSYLIEPYRNGYSYIREDSEGLVHTEYVGRAVLGGYKLGDQTRTFSDSTFDINFVLPLNAVESELDSYFSQLFIKLDTLVNMVNFPYEPTDFTVGSGYAWKLRFGQAFAKEFYHEGYLYGFFYGSELGFENGENLGYSNGYEHGFDAGYEEGVNEVDETAIYNRGYQNGLKTAESGSWTDIPAGIFNSVFGFFRDLTNFTVPIGDVEINFMAIAGAIVTLLLVGFVISLFFGKKG